MLQACPNVDGITTNAEVFFGSKPVAFALQKETNGQKFPSMVSGGGVSDGDDDGTVAVGRGANSL